MLPIYYSEVDLFGGRWNWSGKVYAMGWSLSILALFKKHFPNYIAFPAQVSQKVWALFSLVLIAALGIGYFFYFKPGDTETLFFQATMPGLDEELSFRFIMLGLFSKMLVPVKTLGKWRIYHPEILAVSLLFGFVHGLRFSSEFQLSFDALYFLHTFLLGWIWGYMTLKTKSILLPILSHNLSNFIPNLIGMMK